jgi:hypothetical protein
MAEVDRFCRALLRNPDYNRSSLQSRGCESEFTAINSGTSKVATNIFMAQGMYGAACPHLIMHSLEFLVVGEEYARIFHSKVEATAQSRKLNQMVIDIHCKLVGPFEAFQERMDGLHYKLGAGDLEPDATDDLETATEKAAEKDAAELLEVYWGTELRAPGADESELSTFVADLLGWGDTTVTDFECDAAIDELHVVTHGDFPCQVKLSTRMQAAQSDLTLRNEPTRGTFGPGTGIEVAWLADMATR